MDNVMNRPLFRRREARDRLNEMAGVQGYQVGGPILSGMEMEARRTVPTISDIARPFTGGIVAGPSGAIERQYRQRSIRPEGLASLPLPAEDVLSQYFETTRLEDALAAAEQKRDRAQFYYDNNPNAENIQAYKTAVEELNALKEQQKNFLETVVPAPMYPPTEDRGVLALEGPESIPPDQLDIFNNLGRAADKAVPEVPAAAPAAPAAAPAATGQGVGTNAPAPSLPAGGMEAEARGSRPRVMVGDTPISTGAPSFERTGRGPLITNPAEVAAGLNAPDPAVREKTAADFMQEFMANAPKYEGADKNLMHAMIGFSIAAGDSPNAMTNIAKGLQAGAQMFLQDKAAKDEFDRQIQLSSMKYGLEAAASERERGSKPLTFVALEDTVYKGRPVKKNQSVVIPYSEIERNGGMAPPGFGDTSMVTAMVENEKGFYEALEKARVERQVDDTFAESQRAKFSEATSKALSAQRGLEYMEAGLLTIADGEVTGLKGSANQVAKNLAAAAGLDDVAEQFDSRDEALGFVTKGFQNLIPVALSGTQTGNSISNFDVENLAKAYVDAMFKDGIFSMAFVTDEKLMDSLKSAMNLLESGRQQALTDMTSIERTLLGRTLRSGVEATTVIDPYRSMVPLEESVGTPSYFGSLYRAEDGIYDVMNLGG